MARNKLIVRANYNCRRAKYHRRKVRSAIKYIGGRMRNRDKSKTDHFPIPKQWSLKNGQVVRRVTARRKTIFPGNRPAEYWYHVIWK